MSKKKKKRKVPEKPEGVEVIRGKLKIRPGKTAAVRSSKTVYQGPLFHVDKEEVAEPGTNVVERDIVRHGGSVVILAMDDAKKKDPLVVLERQYRHAAGQFLYEVPAGKIVATPVPI